jgi:hypothetical protein
MVKASGRPARKTNPRPALSHWGPVHQPRAAITNPPAKHVTAAMKRAISVGVIVQSLRMLRLACWTLRPPLPSNIAVKRCVVAASARTNPFAVEPNLQRRRASPGPVKEVGATDWPPCANLTASTESS